MSTSEKYLAREAWLGLKVDSVSDAAAKVRIIATDAGGALLNERFGDGGYAPAEGDIERYGTMTIEVPTPKLDDTLGKLTELGEVRSRSSEAVNVQDEYVDVEARIKTLSESIDRLRALMDKTNDIKQIIELETALSERQSDLDALQARMNTLKSRITMSPITVTLTTDDSIGEPDTGISAAFKRAWRALVTSTEVLITTIGAALPWLIAGGVFIGGIIWLARLSGRRRRPTGFTAPAQGHNPYTQAQQHPQGQTPPPAPQPSQPTEQRPTQQEPPADQP